MKVQYNLACLRKGDQGYVLSSPINNKIGTVWVIEFLEWITSNTMRVKFLYNRRDIYQIPSKELIMVIHANSFGCKPGDCPTFVETGL